MLYWMVIYRTFLQQIPVHIIDAPIKKEKEQMNKKKKKKKIVRRKIKARIIRKQIKTVKHIKGISQTNN